LVVLAIRRLYLAYQFWRLKRATRRMAVAMMRLELAAWAGAHVMTYFAGVCRAAKLA
jgi:hypothetical protein